MVLTMGRLNEARVLLEMRNQPVSIFAQPEEIVPFRDLRDFSEYFGPFTVHLVLLLEKLLRPGRIVALILGLVNFPAVMKFLQKMGHHLLMPFLGRPNIVVV